MDIFTAFSPRPGWPQLNGQHSHDGSYLQETDRKQRLFKVFVKKSCAGVCIVLNLASGNNNTVVCKKKQK